MKEYVDKIPVHDGTIEWVDYVRGLMMEIDKLEMEMI